MSTPRMTEDPGEVTTDCDGVTTCPNDIDGVIQYTLPGCSKFIWRASIGLTNPQVVIDLLNYLHFLEKKILIE